MKILYSIQGTGNGHLARATEIIPILRELGDTDILVSGIQSDIKLPFDVKYKLYGFSFIFGKKGGVDIWRTITKMKLFRLICDIRQIPVHNYDIILNDFEPVTSWACKWRKKKCVGISHQNAVLHPKAPKPGKKDWLGKFILNHYAPVSLPLGFHFRAFDKQNFSPVIRSSIRNANPITNEHYTVYLPAFCDEEIEKMLKPFDFVNWQVFSKHCSVPHKRASIQFFPVSLTGFHQSFINCKGILCNSGFETPSEAIYMGKKLCVIPIKNQYEQACNAALLAEMGITVIEKHDEFREKIKEWLFIEDALQIAYPDNTRSIIDHLIGKLA